MAVKESEWGRVVLLALNEGIAASAKYPNPYGTTLSVLKWLEAYRSWIESDGTHGLPPDCFYEYGRYPLFSGELEEARVILGEVRLHLEVSLHSPARVSCTPEWYWELEWSLAETWGALESEPIRERHFFAQVVDGPCPI